MTENEFFHAYNEIEVQAYKAALAAQTHGVDSIRNLIDPEKVKQKEPLNLGLQLLCDGKDMIIINRALNEIIEVETDPRKKALDQIIREAVLGIQAGTSPGLLVMIINSFVDFGKENALFYYEKELEDSKKTPQQIEKEKQEIEALVAAIFAERKKESDPQSGELGELIDYTRIDDILRR